jgi:uncharacterized protein YegP (UPF0339 family)
MGKFSTKKGKDDQYYFNLLATNGQVILTSEGYTAKAAMHNGIESVRRNAPEDTRYERAESKNNKFYFNLRAANGQVIGTSQMYENAAGRDSGIESVKKNAPMAPIEEE